MAPSKPKLSTQKLTPKEMAQLQAQQAERNSVSRRLGLPLLLVLLIVGGLWLYLNRSAQVTGKIVSAETLQPVNHARVQLDQEPELTLENMFNVFQFNAVQAGEHTLKIKAAGYESHTLQLTLRAGQHWQQDILLKPEQPVAAQASTAVLLALRSPHVLEVRSPQMEIKKTLALPGVPQSIAVIQDKAYVALSGNQIAMVDLVNQQLASKTIELPLHASPFQIFAIANDRKLLVFNKTAQNLMVVNPQTEKPEGEPLKLPIVVTRLIEMKNDQFLAFGPEQTIVVDLQTRSFREPLPLSNALAAEGDYEPVSQHVLQAKGNQIISTSLLSQETKNFDLGYRVDAIKRLEATRWLIFSGQKLFLFNPTNEAYLGPYIPVAGKFVDLLAVGNEWLLATRSENALMILDLNSIQVKNSYRLAGTPQALALYQP